MDRRRFVTGSAALAAGTLAAPAIVRAAVEITFYFPIAVGGPVPKIIDGYAADFEKEHPGITVRPIYAGTYQETMVKALTAHKSGNPPAICVLLSTDMFSLIDEDAIIPFDEKSESEKSWIASFFPAFMENSRTGGNTWGIPFQRSTIVLYWNKQAFSDAGLDPEKPPASWQEETAFAQKLTRRDGGGGTLQWGMQIPSSGFPYWLFQGLTTQNDAILMNEAGDRTFFDQPAVVEALQRWVDLGRNLKVMAPGVIEWGTTPKDFFERKTAMMWTTTGKPDQRAQQCKISVRGRHAAGRQTARYANRRRELLHLQEDQPRSAGGCVAARALDDLAGAGCAMGHRHWLCGGAAGRLGDAGNAAICGGLSGSGGCARSVAIRGRGAVHARQPARDEGAQ